MFIIVQYPILIMPFLVLILIVPNAYAHTTVEVGPYAIEAGWGTEPPVVSFRNTFVFEITETPEGANEGVTQGVKNAFKNLQATAKFGGITKDLEINSESKPGHYFSDVIPTRIGSIEIDFKGEINGVPIDITIPVEDVENTAILDFPPTSGSSSGQDVAALKNALSSLQNDISELKSNVGNIDVSSSSSGVSSDTAYNFGVFGLSLGVAGVILAIIAMIKRK